MLDFIKSKIKTLDEANLICKNWKQTGEIVVFTNGCFDILHRGHAEYLAKARELGTKLIIGLNSDASVKKLKGETRPLQDEQSRATILASLVCSDMIIIFDDETPKKLIDTLIPNVLVKGGDYTIDKIVGADTVFANGGIVRTITFVDGYSTTKIISKMK